MSRTDKKHALRLFLYLRCVGESPTLRASNYFELSAMLFKHYQELQPEVRQRARLLGRNLIRTVGYSAAYESPENVPRFNADITLRAKCPNCRAERLKKLKAIWDTKEEAEAFCSYFPRFTLYPCPAGNGWHVSQRRS